MEFNFEKYQDTIGKINRYYKENEPFAFIINFDKSQGRCQRLADISSENWQIELDVPSGPEDQQPNFEFKSFPVDKNHYKKAFQKALYHIENGDSYLLNLTFPSMIETNIDLFDIYQYALAKHKVWVKDKFVVFSPERFIMIEDDVITTCPMKGTIDASLPGKDIELLNDEKENAEHNTIVDLLRNDLSIVSTHVRIDRLKYLEKVKTHRGDIWQMSSQISGKLRNYYKDNLGELLDKLLPAGSISGAPKNKTLSIIRDIESYDRNFYTGIFGKFDGHKFDSAVMIRYIEKIGNQLWYKSGGGITHLSKFEDEYAELVKKIYVPFI